MQCPKCQADLKPRPDRPSRSTEESAPTDTGVAATAEEALRADAPPGPCPKCGWSTMWNE